ncbi:hypothetical protein FXO38_06922 [Capsicum annuum]|nr:hypothetical protein FXO38_06922 [Capsicum annuum]
MEDKYVAASKAAKDIIWLGNFLKELGVVPSVQTPLSLYCDNSGAVANSKEPRIHKISKHIEIKYHLIWDITQRDDVRVLKIESKINLADPFTKGLTQKVFDKHVEEMGVNVVHSCARMCYHQLVSTKFGELSSLTRPYLEYSGFTGLIPTEISTLSKLQVLSISTVDPYGLRLEPYNFELLLKNLTQLRKLHLDSVSICSTIPLNFSSYLTTLWLPRTQLRGVLPERVFHLSKLEHLDLSFNSLTGPIPSNEFKSNTLEFVSVKQNQLQGPIPKSLLDLQAAKNWTYPLQCYYIRMQVVAEKARKPGGIP